MNASFNYGVAFTSPYVLLDTTKADWLAFLDRQERMLFQVGAVDDPVIRRKAVLKQGPEPNYWNDYVFLAYHDAQAGAITLRGIPDIPASLPHAEREEGWYSTANDSAKIDPELNPVPAIGWALNGDAMAGGWRRLAAGLLRNPCRPCGNPDAQHSPGTSCRCGGRRGTDERLLIYASAPVFVIVDGHPTHSTLQNLFEARS